MTKYLLLGIICSGLLLSKVEIKAMTLFWIFIGYFLFFITLGLLLKPFPQLYILD